MAKRARKPEQRRRDNVMGFGIAFILIGLLLVPFDLAWWPFVSGVGVIVLAMGYLQRP